MESKKPEVFISYSADDRSFAKTLADRLRAVGIEPWLDTATLGPRVVIQEKIEAALSQCRTCLVLVGTDIHIDLGLFGALERRIEQGDFRVIPVLLRGVKWDALSILPDFLHSLQGQQFQQLMEDDAAFQRLRDVIRELASGVTDNKTIHQSHMSAGSGAFSIRTHNAVLKRSIRLPDIDWVEIPAGPFIYGEKEAPQTIDLPRFYISRYPITNSQYQTFIDAGGYEDERWWQDLLKRKPEEPRWKHSNRPRDRVDWYEAVAFTRWLSAQLGYDITLPTEQQWEKAARGTDGRRYPWGEGFNTGDANVNVKYISAGDDIVTQTTAVGMYPHRSSPYSVMDMAGNVFEWCLNNYDNPLHTVPDRGGELLTVRGGSWSSDPIYAQCHFSQWVYSVSPNGFRVVCSSPFTEH